MTTPTHFKLDLPLYIGGDSRLKRDDTYTKPTKRYWLSMNNYRNWHFQSSNGVKRRFKKKIQSQIDLLPDLSALWGEVAVHYRFFPPNRAERDIGNYVAVVDKFFCDAVIESKKLADDNMKILKHSTWEMGEIDKENPRMEAFLVKYVPFDIESRL